MEQIKEKLEYLRGELRAENISYGELIELQELSAYIKSGDVELLEWAGVPEGADRPYEIFVFDENYGGRGFLEQKSSLRSAQSFAKLYSNQHGEDCIGIVHNGINQCFYYNGNYKKN